MSVEMVCERADGVCNLCGADPEEDCPLTDLAPELAEWSKHPAPAWKLNAEDSKAFVEALNKADDDECESCQ